MKVLVIKFGALGDIIFASSVIQKIQTQYKNDTVFLMVSENFSHLFQDWDNLNIHPIKRSGIKNFFKQVSWIRQQHFDLIIDLQSNDRSSLLCALSNAKTIAGNHPRFPYDKYPADKYVGQCHAFERLNQIITAAGLSPATAKPALSTTESAKKKVIDWLNKKNVLPDSYVVMHAGSSPQHEQKRWPFFNKLAQQLNDKGYFIIWVGTGDEKNINQQLALAHGIDATNEFSIEELIALGDLALFAVTNDSAPMHILSCSNIIIIGLFGPTNPRRNHALGHESGAIFAGGELPNNDNEFIPHKIDKISVTDVMDKISNVIHSS